MATADKFIFGEDFGRRGATQLAPSPGERARVEGEARARAAGIAEGRAQAERELDQRRARALENVAAQMAALSARFEAVETASFAAALGFALTFSEAVAGAALRRFPVAALEAAARETFAHVRRTPHCVVRLHESLVDQANEMLNRVARERGFEGRLVVMGEPDMAAGDFSLEWADGGVRRDGEALRARFVEAIERHLAAAPGDGSSS